ncbi:MAG: hypothetical protein ACI3U1_01410 [Peptococcaceae bacterium]
MQFYEKLDFLMQVTQTSNKDLAKGISVDPSFISLLRSGKRKKPQNQEHIKRIALYLAKRSTADFQRHALAEMLGQSALRSAMPVEVLADHLRQWLSGESDLVEQMVERIENLPTKPVLPQEPVLSVPEQETTFYYGNEGRRKAVSHITQIIRSSKNTNSVLIASNSDLDWLFDDYAFANELQDHLLEILQRSFSFYQIMPSSNFLNSYVESLRYWLPLYLTGKTKVFYYPRLRDNLYQQAQIILPGSCVLSASSIGGNAGLNNHDPITVVSTDPELVQAYTEQYQQYLSFCRPALDVHTDCQGFHKCFEKLFSLPGSVIQKSTPLSANTIPLAVLEQCIQTTDDPNWSYTYQMYRNQIANFEQRLSKHVFLDMTHLATAEEVQAGQVYIASPISTDQPPVRYTPETYCLHLQNILRLMDQYENYYFLPLQREEQADYNLFVNANGIALLSSTSALLLLEIYQPEMIQACREHLLRIAEQKYNSGIQRMKIRSQINELIRELQR